MRVLRYPRIQTLFCQRSSCLLSAACSHQMSWLGTAGQCLLLPLHNTPSECCPFIKNFSYICKSDGFMPSDITYCESVFRKSFVENVEVFLIIRTERNNTHFRIDT